MMKHEFSRLVSDLENLKRNFENNRNLVLRAIAIKCTSSIIMGTPHDTGRARGNWQTSIDSPILTEIDRLDAQGQDSIGEVRRVVATFGSNNKSINVTNNLPYINRLNSGWSKQADAGYVERAIEGTKVNFGDDFLLKENR